MKLFGDTFELNGLIKFLSTRLGPDLASVIGVLGPCVGWTFMLSYFHAPILLALLVGYNLKRFEMQLASKPTEAAMLEVKKRIDEFRANSGGNSTEKRESDGNEGRISS